jgi:hypothetical protein
MDQGCGCLTPYPDLGSHDADVVWASQVQHTVQHAYHDGHFGCLAAVGTPVRRTSPDVSIEPQGRGHSRRGPTSAGALPRLELRTSIILGLPLRSIQSGKLTVPLRLIADDGYAGSVQQASLPAAPPSPALPRRNPAGAAPRRQAALF